jgi:hypothetical protein
MAILLPFSFRLSDQAVKCLCEIWQPQDIPPIFLTSSRASVSIPGSKDPALASLTLMGQSRQQPQSGHRNMQLPSPISPTTHPSPISPISISPAYSRQEGRTSADCRSNLVPLKGFVHEVLRRSRTSGTVLQTALCYLEAIRTKVPDLARLEKSGQSEEQEETAGRIICAEDGDVDMPFGSVIEVDKCAPTPTISQDEILSDNGRLRYSDFSTTSQISDHTARKQKAPPPPLPPLPPLPSPLLCPRRAFLASLILASKFTQDRCYSNRAWAKLSGLPPREIGRCERALGDALQWRLWVGKKTPVLPAAAKGRAVVRCRSEGDLLPLAKEFAKDVDGQPEAGVGASTSGLRRWATLPAEAFVREDASMTDAPQCTSLSAGSVTCASNYSSRLAWISLAPNSSNQIPYPSSPHPVSLASTTPPTPTLTDSPSSTESDSSGGDRTIQMSTLVDVPTPPGAFAVPEYGDKASPLHGSCVGFAGRIPFLIGGDPSLSTTLVPSANPPGLWISSADAGVQLY